MYTDKKLEDLNANVNSEGTKKVYQTPRLTTLGGIHQLVQVGAGSNSDGDLTHFSAS